MLPSMLMLIAKYDVNSGSGDVNLGSGAMGVVIRDDKGRFLAAKVIPVALDAASAEAQPVHDGIHPANRVPQLQACCNLLMRARDQSVS